MAVAADHSGRGKETFAPLIGAAGGASIYDFGICNVLIARGAKPDPEMAEEGADALDEPGGAADA
jgi:hypothetical protein